MMIRDSGLLFSATLTLQINIKCRRASDGRQKSAGHRQIRNVGLLKGKRTEKKESWLHHKYRQLALSHCCTTCYGESQSIDGLRAVDRSSVILAALLLSSQR